MARKNNLQERITSLQDYFLSIEVKDSLYIVKVVFPHKWSAYNSDDEVIKVAKSETNRNEWFYYANITEVDLNDIFDLIEETIHTNESVTKKIELMRVKMEELKDLFQTETLERLETLEFIFNKPKQVKRPKRSYRKKTIAYEEPRLASKVIDVQGISPLEVNNEPINTIQGTNELTADMNRSTVLYNNADIDNIDL